GVVVGAGNETVNTPAHPERSAGVWIGTPEQSTRPQSPAPSAINVEPVGNTRLEGADLAQHHGPGILSTVRDGKTQDLILNGAIEATVIGTVTLNSGREMTMRVRQAEAEGFLARDHATGRYHEADRRAQQATVEELARVEAAKREAEALKFDNAVETAVHGIGNAMRADGLNFGDELAQFIGSDGNTVSQPAADWAQAHGFEMKQQLRALMDHMRQAVIAEVLQPQDIDPDAFLSYCEQNRAAATRAAVYAFHGRSLDGFRQLAQNYRDTGGRYRQRRS